MLQARITGTRTTQHEAVCFEVSPNINHLQNIPTNAAISENNFLDWSFCDSVPGEPVGCFQKVVQTNIAPFWCPQIVAVPCITVRSPLQGTQLSGPSFACRRVNFPLAATSLAYPLTQPSLSPDSLAWALEWPLKSGCSPGWPSGSAGACHDFFPQDAPRPGNDCSSGHLSHSLGPPLGQVWHIAACTCRTEIQNHFGETRRTDLLVAIYAGWPRNHPSAWERGICQAPAAIRSLQGMLGFTF